MNSTGYRISFLEQNLHYAVKRIDAMLKGDKLQGDSMDYWSGNRDAYQKLLAKTKSYPYPSFESFYSFAKDSLENSETILFRQELRGGQMETHKHSYWRGQQEAWAKVLTYTEM